MGGLWGRAGGHVCTREISPSRTRLMKSMGSLNSKALWLPDPWDIVWNYSMFANGHYGSFPWKAWGF